MSNEQQTARTWLTIEEAAARLGVTPKTVYTYIEKKELRATKIKRWQIEEEDLKRFVASRANMGGVAA